MPKRREATAIERYLERKDLSIAELARRAGKSWRHLYRVTRGQARMTADMATALQEATAGELNAAALLGLAPQKGAAA